MQETAERREILTLHHVAQIFRCLKTRVSNVLNGKVPGVPRLTHLAMGRRKLVYRAWLDHWMKSEVPSATQGRQI
jgi:hypothetical protein